MPTGDEPVAVLGASSRNRVWYWPDLVSRPRAHLEVFVRRGPPRSVIITGNELQIWVPVRHTGQAADRVERIFPWPRVERCCRVTRVTVPEPCFRGGCRKKRPTCAVQVTRSCASLPSLDTPRQRTVPRFFSSITAPINPPLGNAEAVGFFFFFLR